MEFEVRFHENGEPVPGEFTFPGTVALAAMETHVLEQVSWVGAYPLNPAVEA